MWRQKTHDFWFWRVMQKQRTNQSRRRRSVILENEYKLNRSWFCLLKRFEERIKVYEHRRHSKRWIDNVEKLSVFESSRTQRLLKKMRKRINQLKTQVDVSVESFLFTIIVFSFELKLNHQLNFDVQIWTFEKLIKTILMIDTRIFVKEFVNAAYIKRYQILTLSITKKINLKLANNLTKHALTRMIWIKMNLKDHVNEILCLITSLSKFDIIFDMLWVKKHEMNIEEDNKSLLFKTKRCLHQCISSTQFLRVFNKTSLEKRKRSKFSKETSLNHKKKKTNCDAISVEVFMIMISRKNHEVVVLWSQHFEQLKRSKETNRYLIYNNMTTNFFVISANDYEKFFVKHNKTFSIVEDLKRKMSKKFHKYIDVWNSKLINELSSHRNWNHVINLIFEIKSSIKKTYDLSRDQTTMIKKYIDEMLNKNYIRSSTFEYAVSMLIIKKFDDELRVCVNYRAFNTFIIKNRNASFLLRNTLTRFCSIKYFNKFDIITTFNEIRMRQSDEKKIAFLIRYDFFEYVIMFFEFCNALDIFQSFINVTLHEFLNDFCTSYMNDIFVYSNTREKHVNHVSKILAKFQKTNLYLNVKKCEFFITKMKYLKLIITIKKIQMNSIKMKIIFN